MKTLIKLTKCDVMHDPTGDDATTSDLETSVSMTSHGCISKGESSVTLGMGEGGGSV